MVQTVSGIVLLIIGLLLVFRDLRRSRDEGSGPQKGVLGRFGGLMLGLIVAFLGAALVLPARDAAPTPGVGTNPVDEAIEEGGE